MAARVLPLSHTGSFLEAPGSFNARMKPPMTGFDRRHPKPTRTALRFDISSLDRADQPSYKLNTPDSGFFAVSSTPLKTPESDFSSAVVTPPSTGSGNSQRKRKTVTIDESQTSIVMISPDDLFNTYSRCQGQSNTLENHVGELQPDTTQTLDNPVSCDLSPARYVVDPLTGWPLRRSDSVESRDNPFQPGGDLSREAEDLLSRATIIRDHFYLNEEEKRTLRQHQQEQEQEKQHRSGKHVQIVENPEDVAQARSGSHLSRPHPEAVEERISPQMQANNLEAAVPASSPNGDDSHQLRPKENGRFKDGNATPDNDKQAVSDGGNQAPVPGHTEIGSGPAQICGPGDLQVREADKKKRNKCCTIM